MKRNVLAILRVAARYVVGTAVGFLILKAFAG